MPIEIDGLIIKYVMYVYISNQNLCTLPVETSGSCHFKIQHTSSRERTGCHRANNQKYLLIAPMLSGNIQINPSHDQTVYPGGFCDLGVSWFVQGVYYDGCDYWYHYSCIAMSTADLENLSKGNAIWLCSKCVAKANGKLTKIMPPPVTCYR